MSDFLVRAANDFLESIIKRPLVPWTENRKLKKALQEKDEEISHLNTEVQDAKSDVRTKEARIVDLERDVSMAQDEIRDKSSELNQLRTEVYDAKENMCLMEERLVSLHDEISGFRDNIQSRDTQLFTLRSEIDNFRVTLNVKDAEIVSLQHEIQGAKEAVKARDERIASLIRDIEDGRATILKEEGLSAVYETLKTTWSEMTDGISQLAGEVQDAKNDMHTRETRIVDLERDASMAQDNIRDESSELNQLRTKVHDAKENVRGGIEEIGTEISDPKPCSFTSASVPPSRSQDILDLSGQIESTTESIGRGGFGCVYKGRWIEEAVNTVQLPIVVKVMNLSSLIDERYKAKQSKQIKRELEVWRKIDHKNVLPLLGIAYISPDASFPAFISPWMENGNAKQFHLRHPSFPPLLILYDVIQGLHYLHTFEPEIIHGDIKAVNVLINDRFEACLCDFGLSRFLVDTTLWRTTATQAGGSLPWMSPELMKGTQCTPTKESDIYAYAMTCYEILSGDVPFKSVPNAALIYRVTIENQRPEHVESLDDLWDIITKCWAEEVEHRPHTAEVLELVHESGIVPNRYLSVSKILKCKKGDGPGILKRQ